MENFIYGFIFGVIISAIATSRREKVRMVPQGTLTNIINRLEGSSYVTTGPLDDEEEVVGKEDAIAIVMEELYR